MNIYEKLSEIQQELKVPKNNYNEFGKYSYRSSEDIIEAVKPLTSKYRAVLMLEDEIVPVGDRVYIKSRATLQDLEDDGGITKTAFAREEDSKKGMDASQITGAASSYARKYALNGLFAIDDTRDADSLPPVNGDGTAKSDKGNNKKGGGFPAGNNRATQAQIDEILALAGDKYPNIQNFYSRLEELETRGQISIRYYATKKQGILWTKEDCEAVKKDLQTH